MINHILHDKTRDIYRLFLSNIEDIRTQITSYQTTTISYDLLIPNAPGQAMWIGHLIERITKTYQILMNFSLIDHNDLKIIYEKFLSYALNIEKRLYHDWWNLANNLQPKKLLQKAFIKENKYFLNISFDSKIIIILNESLWWTRLNYDIPYSLTDVYNTRKLLRQMREETNEFIRKYNKLNILSFQVDSGGISFFSVEQLNLLMKMNYVYLMNKFEYY